MKILMLTNNWIFLGLGHFKENINIMKNAIKYIKKHTELMESKEE